MKKGLSTTEIEHTTSSGEHIIFDSKTILLRDARGKIAGYVAVNRDITSARGRKKLCMKSEEHYRMLFTNMTEGFVLLEVIYNEDGTPCDYRYLEMNPGYELVLVSKENK